MTIYQKAIKVRKLCENIPFCTRNNKFLNNKCPYFEKCKVSELINSPCFERIEKLADVIKKEKWNDK